MAQRRLFLVAAFLLNNAFADILVQPGYGQPHSPAQRTIAQYTSQGHGAGYPQESVVHPGYHIELHPVYSDLSHVDNNLAPQILYHQEIPPLVSRPLKRLHVRRFGGATILPPSTVIHHTHIPLPVHHRFRRSDENQPDFGAKSNELVQNNVASESPLMKYLSPVVDLQNGDKDLTRGLDEKHLEVRQSKSDYSVTGGNLLDAETYSKMYPGYHQFRSMESIQQNPIQNMNEQSPQHQQLFSKANSRELPQVRTNVPQINLENLQHAMLLQSPVPREQSARQNHQEIMNPPPTPAQTAPTNDARSLDLREDHQHRNAVSQGVVTVTNPSTKRNFPDPRPQHAVHHNLLTMNEPHQGTGQSTLAPTTHSILAQSETNGENSLEGDAILGTRHLGKHKLRPLKYPYNPYYIMPQQSYNCPCTRPNYVIYKGNDETLSNMGMMQTSVPPTEQVYQMANIQEPNCAPTTEYVMLPQNTYGANYGARYATVPSYADSTPLVYFFKRPDELPRAMYWQF